ncbi:putative uncharacterized protein [Ruminococcus sp. CAG:353]|jgi:hypothetical protein rflaF_19738|nr:hypothetical protein [Oscillospiraceae bacterium]CDE77852.1 putative uncharacterized protein [Ruminococcus sp. CAG:353]
MACFIVPAAEAIVTTAVQKIVKRKEDNSGTEKTSRFSEKLSVLNGLLWGGSGLLAFEHVWHGEIIPSFPFLTAASDPAQTAEMLHEMAVSGTAMALLVTAVWAVYVLISAKSKSRDTDTARSGAGA